MILFGRFWAIPEAREERQIPVYIVEDTSGDVYVVTDEVAAALGRKAKDAVLHEACSLEGATFIIPCKIDGGNAAITLAQAIENSRGAWVQVEWSKPSGHYTHEVKPYQGDKGPVWDVRTFDEVLEASLEGKVIPTVDHVVIQRILHAKT